MGIRGLTTFIQNRSNLYFENYELHDTNLVIDGNSIACQLYKWHCRSNDCFGGDYDKYAAVIKTFFKLLKDSNVVPYVIFDGGYEKRKLATILDRMKNKIQCAKDLNSVTEGSISVFPLFLRETFINVLEELKINKVRCDFEGDSEVASLAKVLNCPVLSYDSDYYIFDALYIPFSTFDMTLSKSKDKTYNYVYCQIYRVEKFLESFGGMDKSNLPILAVLLGNDYIKKSLFTEFYQHIKIQKCSKVQNEQQKVIKSVIVWLQNETIDSAIKKILSRYKLEKRKIIADQIENAMKGYLELNSTFTKYLNLNLEGKETAVTSNMKIDIHDVEENIDGNTEDSSSEEEFGDYNIDLRNNLPIEFMDKFHRCQFPPCFMDIIVQHKYYCIPQIEDYTLNPSHLVSFKIVSAIYKIIAGESRAQLNSIARCQNSIKTYEVPAFKMDLPSFLDLQTVDQVSKKLLLLKILDIDHSFIENCLIYFPSSWHILLISLKYMCSNTHISTYYIYSIILCAIILNYVDTQIGFCRSTKSFDSKFHKTIQNLKPRQINNVTDIIESLENINKDDSILCMNDLIHYFQMSAKLKSNIRLYNRHIVHDLAEFQSCLLHVVYLNALFNYPFDNFLVYKFYDGTFLYNVSVNLKRRTNLDSYIKILLQSAPAILNSFDLIINILKNTILISEKSPEPKKKKKKTKKDKQDSNNVKVEEAEEQGVYDPNNKFSLLSTVS